MPRRNIGPFPVLIDAVTPPNAAASTALKNQVRGLLRAEGASENGIKARGEPKDPDWEHDLDDLVSRMTPHEIHTFDRTTDPPTPITKMVSVKLGTLKAEIDDNDDVCAGIYEES